MHRSFRRKSLAVPNDEHANDERDGRAQKIGLKYAFCCLPMFTFAFEFGSGLSQAIKSNFILHRKSPSIKKKIR